MSSIFGGSDGSNQSQSQSTQQSSSNQSNQAYPYLQGALSGIVGSGVGGAGSQIANMLGLNGPTAQNQGFGNWQNSTGYQFGLNQGLQSITGNAATQGLLNSGSTAKAVDTYGQNYANTQYGNYTGLLQQLLGSGLQGAGLIGSAGNLFNSSSSGTSSSTGNGSNSSNTGGIGSAIGSFAGSPAVSSLLSKGATGGSTLADAAASLIAI